MNFPRFSFLDTLSQALPEAGLFLVGGAIRDTLLGRPTKDYDFVVTQTAGEVLERELTKLGRVDLVGRTFGVYKFIPREGSEGYEAFDIALPRTETAGMSGGYRDVSVASTPSLSIEGDLSRRDFTVNAMAYDLRAQRLIDPFGGLRDLRRRTVRAVGDPARRFQEDYLRILRALRFAITLHFKIEPATRQAITELVPHLNDVTSEGLRVVPEETIGREFLRAFMVDSKGTIELWDRAGALTVVLPEVARLKETPQEPEFHPEGNVYIHTLRSLARLPKRATLTAKLATLFHDVGKWESLFYEDRVTKERVKVGNPDHLKASGFNAKCHRIRAYEHETTGAEITRHIIERLKLTQFAHETPLHIESERIVALVRDHLKLRHIDEMKLTKAERLLFREGKIDQDYFDMVRADILGSHRDLSIYRKGLARARAIMRGKKVPPKPLITGHDILALGIPEGPRIGELLEEVREKQLKGELHSREDALTWLKEEVAR